MNRWAIGDVHGYYKPLIKLLLKINALQVVEGDENLVTHNPKVQVYFTGDFVDRGPNPDKVLSLVKYGVDNARWKAVRGNHDDKLRRILKNVIEGKPQTVQMNAELLDTLNTIMHSRIINLPEYYDFLDNLPYYVILPCGTKITHAYFSGSAVLKGSRNGLQRHLYGPVDTKDIVPETGNPRRIPWWDNYDGRNGRVIFGHYHHGDVIKYEHCVGIDTDVHHTGMLAAFNLDTDEVVYVCHEETP